MMDPSDVQWMPAVAVLGGGLALGAVGLWRLRGARAHTFPTVFRMLRGPLQPPRKW